MEDRGQKVDLPPEVIYEILLRLPVKPLCRFKLVSKPWRSLISDPDFEANYSKLTIENKDVFLRRRRLLFTIHLIASSSELYSLDLDRFLNKNHDVDSLVAVSTKLDFDQSLLRSVCYSNHVLFLSCFNHKLINPVTKESKTLPEVPTWRQGLWVKAYYGLGFDHCTNEYKVINMQGYYDGTMFSVYTLQTDSWRQIDCLFPYNDSRTGRGILLNGSVHWLVEKIADESLVILSFLLAEEEVREIALPPNTTPGLKLGTFRNRLCITSLAEDDVNGPFDERIWSVGVLDEYASLQTSLFIIFRILDRIS